MHSLVLLIVFSLFIPSISAESGANVTPEIQSHIKEVLKVEGKEFRDLNGNGELDPYENWELPVEERVKDLVSQMTVEDKAGLMIVSSHYSALNDSCEEANADYDLLCDSDEISTSNRWAEDNGEDGEMEETIDALGTQKGIDQGLRYFIIRENPSADVIAKWTNEIQEVAERSELGIPAMITSNPRNHISTNKSFGINEAGGEFSVWPGELGLAATDDAGLVKDFGQIAAKEWRASGIQKGYMYMADVVTDPLWGRTNGTFGESPELASDMIRSVVEGFQGEELGTSSVSLTTKHFPGGGARDGGKDPHFEDGRWNPYPNTDSLLKYHIPPFKAAIEAGTTSIMPYYAFPSNEHSVPQLDGKEFDEEVGFAYNKQIITDLLRNDLDFKGYVNTDTGITTTMPWGMEDASKEERYAKAVEAGVNTFSGEADPSFLIRAVNEGLVEEEKLDHSVTFLLTEMMQLGLFEDPYVDPENALAVATNAVSQEKADEAHRKSVVLLRNDEKLLPLNDEKNKDVKLYVEIFTDSEDDIENTKGVIETIRNHDSSITITDNLEEATHAFVWIHPSAPMSDPALQIGPDTGIEGVDRINEIQDTVPTILALNMTNPWLIDNVEPNAAAVISTFGVKTEAIVDVIRGEFNPTGKLPFTIPADQEAIDNEDGDIPGYEEDSSYVYHAGNGEAYEFGYGLSYEDQLEKGGELPSTATHYPNLAMLGLSIAVLSGIVLLIRRRRHISN